MTAVVPTSEALLAELDANPYAAGESRRVALRLPKLPPNQKGPAEAVMGEFADAELGQSSISVADIAAVTLDCPPWIADVE